ncbi:cation-transporting P-type ATPase [Flavobacterium sp. ZS1P14]|uniref:cation-transporting P-type ATPase n=1 Tax=Flavobacterium sp. ZS1P14 TaxID=3401729 RepID=UPI003AAC09B3
MTETKQEIKGLSDTEVLQSRAKYGSNSISHQDTNNFCTSLIEMIKEPMFLLLITATSTYFITGDFGNEIFMAAAIVLVSAISLYQESKSRYAIEALKKLSQPKCKVIRNSEIIEIPSEEIVVGDFIQTEEGTFVP